jgi:ABC-type multidrug transport system fused ATPase/permease subunit
MFFVLALGTFASYFALCWSSFSLSAVSISPRHLFRHPSLKFSQYISTTYRQNYFEDIVEKPVCFYDKDENSAGTLTSRLASDPTQLQELFGLNMALPLVAVFNVMGCIAISFYFGWKLTLVTMFSALPIILIAGFVRVRYEVQFEKMNAAVFAESSKMAAEAISAFRTVASLTLEDTMIDRYSKMLRNHVRKAFLKARFATLILAASDSLELLCMALCFWLI